MGGQVRRDMCQTFVRDVKDCEQGPLSLIPAATIPAQSYFGGDQLEGPVSVTEMLNPDIPGLPLLPAA